MRNLWLLLLAIACLANALGCGSTCKCLELPLPESDSGAGAADARLRLTRDGTDWGYVPIVDPAGVPALEDAIRHRHDCESRHFETARVLGTAAPQDIHRRR